MAAYIQALASRGASFWNDPLQLVLSSNSAALVGAVAAGTLDALINSNRLIGENAGLLFSILNHDRMLTFRFVACSLQGTLPMCRRSFRFSPT